MIDHARRLAPAPLRRVVDVASLGPDGSTITIEASGAELKALAEVNGLAEVKTFLARLSFAPEGQSGVVVTGEVDATVRQTCVVTLDAFDADVRSPVLVHFLPERDREALSQAAGRHHDGEDGEGEPDLPDPIVNGRIDAGALAAEFLTLGLDPYPRKPGADFEGPADADATVSPFAALARLRDMKDT